jgi:DNA-directed RNA polymerase sigma subunit (sigma70/sigma32)
MLVLFLSAEDFFKKAGDVGLPSDAETRTLGERLQKEDADARLALYVGYLPFIAATVKRHFAKGPISLDFIYRCTEALEKGLDSFDFSRGRDAFISYLSYKCKQEITRYIAEEGGR